MENIPHACCEQQKLESYQPGIAPVFTAHMSHDDSNSVWDTHLTALHFQRAQLAAQSPATQPPAYISLYPCTAGLSAAWDLLPQHRFCLWQQHITSESNNSCLLPELFEKLNVIMPSFCVIKAAVWGGCRCLQHVFKPWVFSELPKMQRQIFASGDACHV